MVRNYTDALFMLAKRHEGVEAFGIGAALVERVLEDGRVREFLATPRVSLAQKKSAITRAFETSIPPLLLRFLHVVVEKGRQGLIPAILSAYAALLDRHRGIRHVDVSVARPLSEPESRELNDRLSAAIGDKVIPHVQVRPQIIGGIVIREGDTVYDGSLKRQLDGMRRSLMAVELPREN